MPLNPSNVPYPMANYSHFDQLSYMQNQLSPLAHAPQFNAVPYRHSYSWPRNHLFSFNSCEELSSIKNDYYHEYDRSRGYYDVPFVAMPHLAANPTNFTISSMSMQHYAPEQAQHSQFNFNQSAPATNPNGSQGDFQSRSNAPQQRPTAASSDKTKPKTPLGAPQSATKKNGKAQSANKKKIPRPMNSFMIYAKRHRAQVHLAHPKCDNRKVSKILSETWYAMDAEKKQKYHDLSVEMRREHYRMFPDFKWRSEVPTTPTDFKEVRSPKELPSQAKKPPSNANEGSLNTENVQNNVWTHSPSLPITPTSTENSLSPLYFGASIPISHEPIVPNVQPEFCLGPTPAQLGLKRKNKKSKPADLKIQNPSTNAGAASNATTDNPDLPFVSNNPHFKQLFTELPVFDFSTYRTEQEWNASPSPPSMTYNTNSRKRASTKQPAHLPNKRLVGERFFGPDFNLNHFEGWYLAKKFIK